MVNRLVSSFASSTDDPEYDAKKQMPSIVSRLTQLVFFTPTAVSFKSDIKHVSFCETDMAKKVINSINYSTYVLHSCLLCSAIFH